MTRQEIILSSLCLHASRLCNISFVKLTEHIEKTTCNSDGYSAALMNPAVTGIATQQRSQVCESLQRSGAWGEVRGGRPLLAVRKDRQCITGSCVLCELDREGSQSKEMT